MLQSVNSESMGRSIEPRNLGSRGGRPFRMPGRHHRWRRPGPHSFSGSTGVGDFGTSTQALQEPGSPCALPLLIWFEITEQRSRGRETTRPSSCGAKKGSHSGYRQAKATKCGGTENRVSESLIVPVMSGNPSAGTRRREGATVREKRWRERCRDLRARSPSQRDCIV